jgi:hypothetical protein
MNLHFGNPLVSLRDVPMRLEASRWFAILVFATAIAATAAAQAPDTPPTTSPTTAAGYFPLSGVHRGLHGVAYTVFEGTQPEAMQVEILGVLRNALGPNRDMILARLQGSKPEYTGVVAGMSGSPVYIDGKLLGALSYRIGQFSKEPIAGITPIEQMLAVRDMTGPACGRDGYSPHRNSLEPERLPPRGACPFPRPDGRGRPHRGRWGGRRRT